jgi:hypothetical protein
MMINAETLVAILRERARAIHGFAEHAHQYEIALEFENLASAIEAASSRAAIDES